jgi:hypothetical protein
MGEAMIMMSNSPLQRTVLSDAPHKRTLPNSGLQQTPPSRSLGRRS